MTLIVGIVCTDGIVVAADSQTTRGVVKMCSTNKISAVEFKNNAALVAEAGGAMQSNQAVENLRQLAREKIIYNDQTIAKTVEASVRVVKNNLMHLHPSPNAVTPLQWQEYFCTEPNSFDLILAYYYHQKPCLYTFDLDWATAYESKEQIVTKGIGRDLGEYLLKSYLTPDMDCAVASVVAVQVIDEVVNRIEGCGSPIKLALIRPAKSGWEEMIEKAIMPDGENYHVLSQMEVEELLSISKPAYEAARHEGNKVIRKYLKENSDRIMKEIGERRKTGLIDAIKKPESRGRSIRSHAKN
jgi:20S proteasome alpha/beta subunit